MRGLTEAELMALAEDRPHPRVPYPAITYYGMGKWLKRYAGVPDDLPICVNGTHGPAGKLTRAELETETPAFLVESVDHAAQWREVNPGVPCHVMGSPFVHYRRMRGIERRPGARGTVAFATHGTHWIEVKANWVNYCRRLKELPEPFQPVTVCLYWTEVLRGVHRYFLDEGFPVVTAGHMYDEAFVERFYAILSAHRFATSNSPISSLRYAVEMGIPFFLYGQDDYEAAYNHGDPNRPLGLYGAEGKHPGQEHVWPLFAERTEVITPEQRRLVERELGVHDAAPGEELAQVLWQAYRRRVAKAS